MSTNTQYADYKEYKTKKEELAFLMGEASKVVSDLNMTKIRENLVRLSNKVSNETFKVLVVGTFKNGKSTFINSLLGEEVLPAYALPCTAVVNEVKWGEQKAAKVFFKNPLPAKLSSGIPEKAMAHMRAYSMKDIPPLMIPYDEIEDYAVISIGFGKEEIEYESPYEKIEVYWPLPILQNGVEIIDSPGLNECATRTQVTMNYISKADAILFVLNATQILAAEEMRVIEHTLKENGFDDPFIIVNRFDAIRNREKDMMRQYVRDKLDGYTTNEFFFVSALNALDGKLDDDEELLNSSGIPQFEDTLSFFLTKQKGKAKLAQPARELRRILNDEAVGKTIPMQRAALATSLDGLKAKYESSKPRLDELKKKKEQLYNKLLLKIEQVKPEFRRMATGNIMDLADSVPAWVNEYQPKTAVGFFPKEDTLLAVSKEISTYVNEKIEDAQSQWKSNVLEPVINEKTKEIFGTVETDLEKFFSELDAISVDVAGRGYSTNDVPAWQRVAGAIGGFAIGGVGLAISGGVNGIGKEFAKSLAFELGAFTILGAVGLLNPFTLLATIAGVFIYNADKHSTNTMGKLKTQVVNEFVTQLSNSAESMASSLETGVYEKLKEIAKLIADAMDIEINETENQINSIIAEMEKGKENIAAREAVILGCENKIKDINSKLTDLVDRVMRA